MNALLRYRSKCMLTYLMGSNLRKTLKANRTYKSVQKTVWANSHMQSAPNIKNTTVRLLFSIFTFLGLQKDDENTPEEKLITVIKRSILCIQREEYDKAERMLHLALKMAQDLQHKDGITYIYDVMANLAMEREDFKKAEKLFAEVMKRLFQDGYTEDDIKMLSISSKLAHMAEVQGDLQKANLGFAWSLQKIETHIKNYPNDIDAQELWSLTKNWFGQLLMKQSKYEEAIKCFEDALSYVCKDSSSKIEETIIILNNLSVAFTNLKKYDEAKKLLSRAMELLKTKKDLAQEAVVQANLGLIYLQEGLWDKAKNYCSQAWKKGKKENSDYAIEQAEYCLAQIKLLNK